MDYQVAGALGYKIKPTVMLQLGWRYLDVNYRPSSTFVYDAATRDQMLPRKPIEKPLPKEPEKKEEQ